MTKETSDLTLNNGAFMPALGLGVFQSPPKETREAVAAALNAGYRLIDTAASYMNEKQVGEGIKDSGVKRSDIFIVTKLWISDYGKEEAKTAFDASLRRLGTNYVDLYLMHQPTPSEFDRTIAAYKTMETFITDKRARAIGVSNFSPTHLKNLMAGTSVVPAVNQVELHPFFIQKKLREVHRELGITTQSWSPIGGINVYRPKDPNAVLNPLKHPTVLAIAEKYKKTPAQVVLRWQIDHGNCAIPKSVHAARIKENFGVFDFTLMAEEVANIDKLDTGVRGGPNPETLDTKTFSFKIDNSVEADNAARNY
ncbi:MAG: aldo/keto reductase [Proteobacteria bacterium]|nr:MAG: aldo/keto reductase [Pseudomonadota bacterium]